MRRRKTFKKITVAGFAVVGLICLFLHGILEGQYGAAMPQQAQPENGRIYPINVHGAVVYLNQPESARLKELFWAGVGLIFVAVIASITLRPFDDDS